MPQAGHLRQEWDTELSPPPPEDWESEAREWEYVGIVGEATDAYWMKSYEVKWKNWQRNDAMGTNTTWQRSSVDMKDEERFWDRERADERAVEAKESLDLKIGLEPDQPWHDDITHEVQNAYVEKAIESRRRGSREYYGNWEEIAHITEGDSDDDQHDGESARSASPEIQEVQRNLCRELQTKWNQAIRLAGAAALDIISSPDEQIPPGLEDFEYCENHYVRAEGVDHPDPTAFLVGCECHQGCNRIQSCDCQAGSDMVNEAGERQYAYNSEHIFKFNLSPGVEVVECNSLCNCPDTCQNRVAQRPRDVPMEVFHTGDHGWGVCAKVQLPVGKVLGIYTGNLIHRRDAEGLSEEHRSYIFDLDAHETEDDNSNMQQYSVDSFNHGNWSRFIK
ncbi:hypothetical protein EVJ58_g5622 [Rhodofomes roseus]|uniref:Pre-SET domain-containing protein n=1 Tax=Rhodofomes roseus TaxID=34475 RepID=A0A4Y9YCF4_9APHY|nr:hypothetical protein EVJ58_g5622 [Rhodofomes roseus]